jgi:hypothetical protein
MVGKTVIRKPMEHWLCICLVVLLAGQVQRREKEKLTCSRIYINVCCLEDLITVIYSSILLVLLPVM